MKVLVAYASEHGSTAEVANTIGDVLQQGGLDVTVTDAQLVNNVDGYDAFVFGSAVHSGTWLPQMTSFLKRYTDSIARRPVYIFVTCIRVMEQFGLEHVMEYYMVPEILELLNVQDRVAFAGKLNLNDVDWNERWTLAARYDGSTWPSSFDGDFRDWDQIKAWAEKVAAGVQAAAKTGQKP